MQFGYLVGMNIENMVKQINDDMKNNGLEIQRI